MNKRTKDTPFGGLSRSRLMARVKATGNMSTELKMATLLRENLLHGWRRHFGVIGKPDFAWPKHKIALFVDGCFWHGHNCRNLSARTNREFWQNKILNNKLRDKRVNRSLRAKGWHVFRVWECLLAKNRLPSAMIKLLESRSAN